MDLFTEWEPLPYVEIERVDPPDIDGFFHPPRLRPEWAHAILREQRDHAPRWDTVWVYDAVYDRVIVRWAHE